MDIKKLTQEVLLKNMTPEQQKAVLESVQASVQEAKAVQKQKIAENVDLVLVALKRIEADMLKRVEGSAKVIEDRVKTIKDGKDGNKGDQGDKGDRGDKGDKGERGDQGIPGINGSAGERGEDGVGVQDAHIDFDGSLIISLTNGQELNVGEVVPFDVAEKIRVIGNGGGTSQYVIDTLASLQTQISAISGTLTYKGTWNASTNTPTLTSSVGTTNWYYVVSVAGSTNLNGVTDWQVGDWAIYNGSTWQKIDQTNLVTSVAGRTGDVTLAYTDISGLGTAATTSSTAYATAAQGAKADTALQSITSGNVTTALGYTPYNATNPAGYTTNTGTVTSVSLSTPTGLTVTGSPITSSGTLALAMTTGYSIPTTASQTNWDTAYTDRNKWDGGATGLVAATGRTSLGLVIGTDVLSPTGSAASLTGFPTFNQNTTGSAGSLVTTGFSIVESGGKLLFKYGDTTIASMSSTGVLTSATNIVSNGTP